MTMQLNRFTCYTPVNPTKSAIHSLFNSWASNGGSHNIIKSHDNICSNSILHTLQVGKKTRYQRGKHYKKLKTKARADTKVKMDV